MHVFLQEFTIESKEISLELDELVLFFPLGIGTTEADFQADGNLAEDMGWFINLVIPGAMLVAVAFNMVVEIPSGPLDFVVSSESKNSRTSSSVIRY